LQIGTVDDLKAILASFPEFLINFDELWDPSNVVLIEGPNAMAFENRGNGVYFGHYYFTTYKGSAAIKFAKACIAEMFELGAVLLAGITNDKKAQILTTKIGASFANTLEYNNDTYRVYVITNKDS